MCQLLETALIVAVRATVLLFSSRLVEDDARVMTGAESLSMVVKFRLCGDSFA